MVNIQKVSFNIVVKPDISAPRMTQNDLLGAVCVTATMDLTDPGDPDINIDYIYSDFPALMQFIKDCGNNSNSFEANLKRAAAFHAIKKSESMTDEQKFTAILHWVNSALNEPQLSLCAEVAKDHFVTRSNNPELYNKLIGAISLKTLTLPK